MNDLEKYIEEVHNEPFNIISNNCIHKHGRIVNKARELGHKASLIGCISVIPIKPAGGIPLISPHFYAEVDDKTVDVSLQPDLERGIWRNEDILRLFSINLSKLSPAAPQAGPPLPRGLRIKWPWKE